MAELVARNAALKAGVVSEDEREGGRRMILNYGHTAGHANEAVTGYATCLHGEAISVGMMIAATIGEALDITPPAVRERQSRIFELYGLPRSLSGVDPAAVLAATALDKKVAAKKVRWILLRDFGEPVVTEAPEDVALAAISQYVSA
jgi:3-dehydroquinate synthetase